MGRIRFPRGQDIGDKACKRQKMEKKTKEKETKIDKNIPVLIYHIEGVVFFIWCYCKEEQGVKEEKENRIVKT